MDNVYDVKAIDTSSIAIRRVSRVEGVVVSIIEVQACTALDGHDLAIKRNNIVSTVHNKRVS